MSNNPFMRTRGNIPEFHLISEDLRILLDQIPTPALLISLSAKSVVAANLSFTELTGFGTDELHQSGIERVLLDGEIEKFIDGSLQQCHIARKNKNPLQAAATILTINKADQLALLKIQEIKEKNYMPEPVAFRMLAALQALNKALPDFSLDDLIRNLLITSKEIFLAKTTTFYLYGQKNSQALKVPGEDTLFPQAIPAIEMKRLNQIDFWEPGKRVLSEIHRVGRLNNLSCVITLPVSIDEENQGLLIIVLEDVKAKDHLMPLFQIFSDWVHILVKNQQLQERMGINNSDLAIENDEYSQFYENSGDCALIVNDENVIIDFNQNTAQFLKYSPMELLNQKAGTIFENSELAAKLQEKNGTQPVGCENPISIFDREGNKKPVFYKILPINKENIHRKLLIISDASILVDAERKIQQYENKAALGEVIADFAHEVRNPIHSFVSGLQVMKKKVDPQDPMLDTINQMIEDCFRINDLMESVLSYSRQKVENFKNVDIEFLLRHIISQMNSKFMRAGVSATVSSKTDSRTVYADQRSLEQAFINIITNAFDAIKQDGGVIAVQIVQNEADDRFLDISISDTGPGIPPEIQEKIFEPFVSGKPKGTGLGLAITKRIVEAHQGRIELETYPGGTIFKVILPTQEIPGEQA